MTNIDYYLPDDSDEDGRGRTGFLSTRKEWHTLGFGVAVGIRAGAEGDMQSLSEGLGIVAGGSRVKKGFSDKYINEAREEFPYFVLGVLIGFGSTNIY